MANFKDEDFEQRWVYKQASKQANCVEKDICILFYTQPNYYYRHLICFLLFRIVFGVGAGRLFFRTTNWMKLDKALFGVVH